jgi:beta-phosphoglucomutase
MTQSVQVCIFDLDGVVVFTDTYHFLGWKRLANEQGWAFDESLNDRLRGVSRMQSLEIILEYNGLTASQREKETWAAQKNEYYKHHLATSMNREDLFPGAVEFIHAVRDTGMKTGLASSSKNALTVLRALDLEKLFDAVVTGQDIHRSKPDPEIFLVASTRLQVPPNRCVVFEDAYSGVEAALSAGMGCVGVGDPERLGNAPVVITSYDKQELPMLLRSAFPA